MAQTGKDNYMTWIKFGPDLNDIHVLKTATYVKGTPSTENQYIPVDEATYNVIHNWMNL